MLKNKIKLIFILSCMVTGLLSFISGNVLASIITYNTSSFANSNYDPNYSIGSYGSNPRPTFPLGGVTFDIPSSGNNMYHFMGNNSITPEILTLNLSVSDVSNAYLLLNTGWGYSGFKTGTVTFNTQVQSYTINLVNGINIRDWRFNYTYANSTTDPNSQEVYTVNANRIDMLTVPLPSFLGDTLTSIEIADFGWDGYSHIRLAGVTLETTPVPEPNTMFLLGVGLIGVILMKRKINIPSVNS